MTSLLLSCLCMRNPAQETREDVSAAAKNGQRLTCSMPPVCIGHVLV
jgi:hypothetical protein